MAGFTESVRIVIDVVADKSASALNNLKTSVSDADGAFGKLKAGAGSLATSLGPAGLMGAAAAAGGAVVAFAAASVGKFQETALAADKFRNATGLSLEESSKWIAVADDVGISADTIQSAFIKMEKQLGTNKAAFKEYGVEVKKNADGTTNLQQTLLGAIDAIQRIKDPTDRAAASAKLFGKGYAEVAELLQTSSADIVKAFGEVSDAQIIDESEVQKAKEYRAAMDDLKDSVGDVQREIGEALVPALADLASVAADTITVTVDFAVKGTEIFDKLNDASGGIFGDIRRAAETSLNPVGTAIGTVRDAYNSFLGVTKDVGLGTQQMGTGFDAIKLKAQEMGAAIGPAGTSVGDLNRVYSEAAQGAADVAAANDAARVSYEQEAAAARAASAGIPEHANAQLAAFDATFAVKDAQDQFATSLAAATAAEQDATKSSGDKQKAYDDETQAAEKVALAIQRKAEQDAKASGSALTAAQSNEVLIGALQTMSNQASGPTKAALEGLIANLQTTGQQHPTPTVDLIDYATGKVKTASQLLAEYGATSSMADIGVNDNATARIREAIRLGQQFAGSSYVADATLITHNVARAQGGPVAAGQAYTVGERGTETFVPKTDGVIIPADATAAGKAAAANGLMGATNVTINMPAGTDPAAVQRAIDRYRLRNGTRQ